MLSLYHLTDARNISFSKDTTDLLHLFHLIYAHVQIVLAIQNDINMKMMTTDFFIIRMGHDWSKSRMLQILCARPPWQEQVVEESTTRHKCFECDPNEHNWFTTTWYPYTLWGPLFKQMLHWDINQHRGMVLLVLINEIQHLRVRCMVLYLLKTSCRCCPL